MKKRNELFIYTGIWASAVGILAFLLLQNIGDARIVNYSGIVRGATQQLVKQELRGLPNDALIARLDGIIEELRTGRGGNNLQRSSSEEYLGKLEHLRAEWAVIKREIAAARRDGDGNRLFALSEAYFDLADDMVLSAERHADAKLKKSLLLLLLYLVVIMAAFIAWNRKKQRELEEISYRDRLTGIGNRAAFEAAAARLLAARAEGVYTIIDFDIDDFKFVNDTYGYQFGDQLLKVIAGALAETFPDGACARLGADNFVVLARHDTELVAVLQRALLDAVRRRVHLDISESLSFSIGAYIIENKGRLVQAMLDKAGMAHKNAKKEGRGAVVWYNEKLLQKLLQEHQLTTRMNRALAEGEFQLFLQPKLRMETLSVIGAEALVRWETPQGRLPPDAFIPLFERNGFIAELDFYMLRRVCAAVKEQFCDRGVAGYPISVNFSRVTLYQRDFYKRFIQTVEAFAIPFRYLELEITESAFNGITDSIVLMLQRLREADFLVSMDDFGAGYSSLNLLNTLPIDILKLDKEFLKEGTRTQKAKGVITCVVDLAHALSMQVICEGVELEEHVAFLKNIRCEFGQGYYFSRPLAAADFWRRYPAAAAPEQAGAKQ